MVDFVGFDEEAFRAFELAGWTEVARRYDTTFGTLTGQTVEPVMEAARIDPGVQVLNLAYGSGRLSTAACARGGIVTGVDLTPAMVAEAASRNPDATFEVGDAEALPFDSDTFDVVVCGFGVLHFTECLGRIGKV